MERLGHDILIGIFASFLRFFQHQYNKVGNTKLVIKSPQEKTTAGFTIFCPDLPGGSLAVLENNNIFTTGWFGNLPWYYSVAKIKKVDNFKLYTWALKKDTKHIVFYQPHSLTINLGLCPIRGGIHEGFFGIQEYPPAKQVIILLGGSSHLSHLEGVPQPDP